MASFARKSTKRMAVLRNTTAVAATCILGSMVCLYLARPAAPSELWVTKPVIDHGEVSQGQEIQATFELVNRFPQSLTIGDVFTSCTCSRAKLSKRHVAPGENLSLTVSWKTGSLRGKSGTNLQVFFKLADGSTDFKLLRIEGTVIPDIRFDPAEIVFAGGQAETASIRFHAGRQRAYSIIRVRCDHAAFKAALHGNDCVTVDFRVDQWVAGDRSEPHLIVETDSVNVPQMFIPL